MNRPCHCCGWCGLCCPPDRADPCRCGATAVVPTGEYTADAKYRPAEAPAAGESEPNPGSWRSRPPLLFMLAILFLPSATRSPAADPAPPARLNLTHETSFVVYPRDCNHLGTLFGGKTLAEMDRAAGVCVRRLLYAGRVRKAVTAGMEGMQFRRPGKVGDLIFVKAAVAGAREKVVFVHVRVERETEAGRELLADGTFVFAAVDAAGRAAGHGIRLPRGERPCP